MRVLDVREGENTGEERDVKNGVKRCPPKNSGSHYSCSVLCFNPVLPLAKNDNNDFYVSHILLFFSWSRANEWSPDPKSFSILEQK